MRVMERGPEKDKVRKKREGQKEILGIAVTPSQQVAFSEENKEKSEMLYENTGLQHVKTNIDFNLGTVTKIMILEQVQ